MNNYYKRMLSVWLVLSIGFCTVAFSQTTAMGSLTSVLRHNFREKEKGNRIKWTWQLPDGVIKAFNTSSFCNWYIEKMFRYTEDGKFLYAFDINNSNLLDGDHLPCFTRKSRLTVTNEGTVVGIATSE